MKEIFVDNLDIIYFLHGISFSALSIIVIIQLYSYKENVLSFTRHLWLIGAFGFLQGFYIWIKIFLVFKPDRLFLSYIGDIFLFLSYIFLTIFSLEFYNITSKNKIKFRRNYFIFFVFVLFVILYFTTSQAIFETLIRYLLCFIPSIIIGKTAYKYYELDKENIDKYKIKIYIKFFGVCFYIFGILDGVIAEKPIFLTDNFLNSDNFLIFFYFPVQILRMFCAGAITYILFNILKTFSIEYGLEKNNLLQEMQKDKEELIFKTQELEKANTFKNEFISSVTHELKTPLNSILGFTEILKDKDVGPLSVRQLEYIENIQTSGKRLLKMIQGILDTSKYESHKMPLNITNFVIKDLMSQVLNEMHSQIVTKKIDLEINNNFSQENMLGDVYKFRNIIDNLISNAVKFTPPFGKISIKVTDYTNEYDGVKLKYFSFEIADSGIGIDAKDLPKIFQEFVQLDHKIPGTGVGLSLSKKFIQVHGGDIWVKSEPGKGSVFTFILPIIRTDFADMFFQTIQAIQNFRHDNIFILFGKLNNINELNVTGRIEYNKLVKDELPFLFKIDFFYKHQGIFLTLTDIDTEGAEIIQKKVLDYTDKFKLKFEYKILIKSFVFKKNNTPGIFAKFDKNF